MSEQPGFSEELDSDVSEELRPPRHFKVLLHNDDYTTMEFVVDVLLKIFRKPMGDAQRIMLNVHRQGVGLAGIYTAQIAETKIQTVRALAKEEGFPLLCTMEPE